MKIKTKRLVIRELEKQDLTAIVEQVNNLNVSRNLDLVPHPYIKKDAEWFINHCKKEAKKKPRENYELAIILKEEGTLIGVIGITHVDIFKKKATFGYWLGEKYWGKGIMSEAGKAMTDFGFTKLKLKRIEAGVYTGNIGSERVLQKLGFKYEGLARKAARPKSTGEFHDAKMYGLLRGDWK